MSKDSKLEVHEVVRMNLWICIRSMIPLCLANDEYRKSSRVTTGNRT